MKEGFDKIQLKDACSVFADGDWIERKDQSNEGIRLVQTGNIGFGFFKDKKDKSRYISEETFNRLNCTEIVPGDLLVSRLPDPVGKSCIIPEINSKMITGVDCTIIRPKDNLSSEFLRYYQMSHQYLKDVQANVSGATRQRISRKKLGLIEIPLPPLPQQKQIVSILDKVFAAIDKAKANAEQNLQNSKELFESYLQNVFENKGDDWEIKKLIDVCVVERGSSPRPIKKYITDNEDGVNWIKIGDTKNIEKYIYETNQKITKEGAEKSRFVEEGDFILSNSMSFGKPYIMKTQGYIHDGWFKLKLHDFVDTEYFYQLLSSKYVNDQFHSLASGSVVKNISGDLVKKVILPIAPITEQKKTVQKINAFSLKTKKLESIYTQKIADLEEMKKSILQKAFSG